MCGIHGILALSGDLRFGVETLNKMGQVTVHRGPDDSGHFGDNSILLGMRRLSIIDLEGGHQPIPNEDESIWVVCNGEIYNFRELRSELIGLGHEFRTGSDAEVAIHAYEQFGLNFLERLSGMFGLALWDQRTQTLILARDRLGIKPVYYTHRSNHLIFASESKSILAVPGVGPEISQIALREYLALGYVPSPLSLFDGISKLEPGTALIVKNGEIETHRYWALPRGVNKSKSDMAWIAEIRDRLSTAVKMQMVSDVPLGAFLSGGIDSSSVVALMATHSREPIRTYSIGFSGSSGAGYYNELPYAKSVADAYGTRHREILVEPDVADLFPKLIWHMDEPIADAAFFTTFLVAEFAREDVKVILSGVGGDELFGGYRRYLGDHYSRYLQMLPSWVRRRLLHPLAASLPSDRHSALLNFFRQAQRLVLAHDLTPGERYRAFVEVFSEAQQARLFVDPPDGFDDSLSRAFESSCDDDPLRQLMEVDLATQLPDDLLFLTDKMTMATSLECRVPLLDHELTEIAAGIPASSRIPNGQLKYLLKQAVSDLLPEEIINRKKRGFGAPLGAWFKNELAPLVQGLLSQKAIEGRGLLNWPAVVELVADHEANRADHTDHLVALVSLEMWCRIFLDGQSPSDLSDQIRTDWLSNRRAA